VILGADTVVVLDDRILGKPKDMEEAKRFLRDLSGRTHVVLTGVTLIDGRGHADTWLAASHVTFKPLTDKIIDEYVRLTNPLDKAGAYGIQSHGGMLVERVDGLLSNVIGLPVEEVVERLKTIEW
jgi:septum formation protein